MYLHFPYYFANSISWSCYCLAVKAFRLDSECVYSFSMPAWKMLHAVDSVSGAFSHLSNGYCSVKPATWQVSNGLTWFYSCLVACWWGNSTCPLHTMWDVMDTMDVCLVGDLFVHHSCNASQMYQVYLMHREKCTYAVSPIHARSTGDECKCRTYNVQQFWNVHGSGFVLGLKIVELLIPIWASLLLIEIKWMRKSSYHFQS